MSNEKLIEGLREVREEMLLLNDPNVNVIDQAIAALSTESIDVERLRELIQIWDGIDWSNNQYSSYTKDERDTANMLRQLLRIAEGEK